MSVFDNIMTMIAAEGMGANTDAQVATRLNEIDSFDKPTVTGSDVFNALDRAEWLALSATDQQVVRDIFTLGDSIPTASGTNVRAALLAVFGAGTTTRTNLNALITQSISVHDYYGIPAKYATESAVAKARAM